MDHTSDLTQRVLRDIDNGVLALDGRGNIIYMNPQCGEILGCYDNTVGRSYAAVFYDMPNGNDEFHQFVLDAVYQKDRSHRGVVKFVDGNNIERYIKVTSSYLKNECGDGSDGVVMVLSDVTEQELLRKKKRDASVVFACVTACVCLYLFLLGALEFFGFDVPTKALTQVINAMVLVVGVIIYKNTDFSRDDLGLKLTSPKSTFLWAFSISAAVVAVLIGAKLFLIGFSPDFFEEGTPFWNWDLGIYAWTSYLFTSVVQEFLARSMIYGSIRKMFDGKKGMVSAILLSSLLFGAVHIAHGFMYMFAAIILLGALGVLYDKQRNIWGVAIIHYVLGQAACCLGFLA